MTNLVSSSRYRASFIKTVVNGAILSFFVTNALARSVGMAEMKASSTRFYTEILPTEKSEVWVRDSVSGNFMPSVANGYIGTVIYSDAIHVSGVFNGRSNPKKSPIYPVYLYEHAHRARLPSSCALEFKVPGVSGKDSYALDVMEGVFYHWFQASQLSVEQRIYAHRSRMHLLIVEISVKNTMGRPVTLEISNNRGKDSRDIDFTEVDVEEGLKASLGKVNITETEGSFRPEVAMAWTEIPSTLNVSASLDEQTWYFITAVATNLDTKFAPMSEAVSQWSDAVRVRTSLLKTHKKAWKEVWNTGSIDIDGDLKLSQAVYGSMYYILSSTRADWPYGLSPGGLPGGEEYMGHTFWDQDIWMYPFLVLLHPDLARASLKYRYDRLPAARKVSRKYGYKGAMFPWESALTGLQVSPGERYGKSQNHITGDVTHAAKLYWYVAKDAQWLRQIGYEIARQTAEYWASRVQYRSDDDTYVINHVMPPDEYQYPVNNSVYTNVVAKLNLEFAVKVGKMLGQDVPEEWCKIAQQMFIPFDEEKQYHPEYEGYNLNIHVKQADTILIGYPLMYDMDKKVRSNDLNFYENITNPNGPAMTHSMFAIGWLELGEGKRAEKPFMKNFENIVGPFQLLPRENGATTPRIIEVNGGSFFFKVWVEQRNMKGAVNFITGAGGFLQTITFGYGGFRLREEQLEFNPTLPPKSTKMTITGIHYLGNQLKFTITTNNVEIDLLSKEEIAPFLEVIKDGKSYRVKSGEKLSLSKGKGVVRMRKESAVSSGAPSNFAHTLGAYLVGIIWAFLAGITR